MKTQRRLTGRKELAIASLMKYRTIEEAARETGVTDRTVRSWLRDTEFAATRLELLLWVVGMKRCTKMDKLDAFERSASELLMSIETVKPRKYTT